jgi:hypothetical protein
LIDAVINRRIGAKDNIGRADIGSAIVRSKRSENLLEVRAIMEPRAAAERER